MTRIAAAWRALTAGWPALALAAAALALAAGPATALEGAYVGIDAASGMRLTLSGGGEVQDGRLTDPYGNDARFEANRLADGAEATFEFGGETVFMQIADRPSGALVVLVPISPDGILLGDRAETLAFVPEGTEMPERPDFYIEPPRGRGAPVDAVSFLQSYEFWPPDGVGRGYVGVLPRYRTVMRLFPALQTDIIWKLCGQSGETPGLAEALRGQGVTCQEVAQAVTNAQRTGRFSDYKRAVAADRALAREAVNCARRFGTRARCEEVSRLTGEAAVSLRTAANVVAEFR